MIVLDSSAAIDYLLDTPPAGRAVARELDRSGLVLAPHLLDAEVASALRRAVSAGSVDEPRATLALAHLAALRVVRYPLGRFLPRVWELRHSLTAPDAFFVALAEEAGVPLLTTDARLARSHGHRAEILAP